MRHPGENILIDHARREASEDRGRPATPWTEEPVGGEPEAVRTRLERHLEDCKRCRERLGEWRALFSALLAPALGRAPESWITRALRTVEALSANSAAAPVPASRRARLSPGQSIRNLVSEAGRVLEEIRATLVLDSFSGVALPGIRGAARSDVRQLCFDSAVGRVHVLIEPLKPGRVAMRGQLLPAGNELSLRHATAVLSRDGREIRRRLSSEGEFLFASAAAPPAELRLEWSGRRLRMPLPEA